MYVSATELELDSTTMEAGAPFVSLICAVRSATADAGSSSPSQPFVLFRRFLDADADELSSVSRAGESVPHVSYAMSSSGSGVSA